MHFKSSVITYGKWPARTPPPLHMEFSICFVVFFLKASLTLRQWSDLLTIFPKRWHLKVLNFVCFWTFTCEGYAQDSLKKYPDSYLSSWQQVTRPCAWSLHHQVQIHSTEMNSSDSLMSSSQSSVTKLTLLLKQWSYHQLELWVNFDHKYFFWAKSLELKL